MQKLLNFVPVLVVAGAFVPSLLIDRHAGNQPVAVTDIAFVLPLFAYFWPLLMVNRVIGDASGALSDEDRRNYSLLAAGLISLLFVLWLMALLTGAIQGSVAISTTVAFGFCFYDVVKMIRNLRTTGDLHRIVWLHFFAPFFVAAALYVLAIIYTGWPVVPNPIALFFILRAFLSVINQPLHQAAR